MRRLQSILVPLSALATLTGAVVVLIVLSGWNYMAANLTPPADTIGLLLFYGMSVALGHVFIRCGLRLQPIRASGRTNYVAILFLWVCLAAILSLLVYVWLTNVPKILHFSPEIAIESEKDVTRADQFFKDMLDYQTSLWFLTISLAVILSVFYPLIALLLIHYRSASLLNRPFLLFLRRFEGVGNSSVVGAVLRGLPRKMRLVFFTAPADMPRASDPFLVAFTGIFLRHPFRTLPIHLKSDGSNWVADVETVSQKAIAIVFDVGSASPAIEEEKRIVRSLPGGVPVLWLSDKGDQSDIREADQQILYRGSKARLLARISATCLLIYVGTLPSLYAVATLVLSLMDWRGREDPLVQLTNFSPFIFGLLISVPLARMFVPSGVVDAKSQRAIREAVPSLEQVRIQRLGVNGGGQCNR